VFPYENPYLVPFEAAVRSLNPLVAIKVCLLCFFHFCCVCTMYSFIRVLGAQRSGPCRLVHCVRCLALVLGAPFLEADLWSFGCSPEDAAAIYIDRDTRIQILETMNHLPQAEKEQCGAFLVRPSLVLRSRPSKC
jgi:hypothetical protein